MVRRPNLTGLFVGEVIVSQPSDPFPVGKIVDLGVGPQPFKQAKGSLDFSIYFRCGDPVVQFDGLYARDC
jgi:hypothetical protein